jgi:signal transduction histidine kinase
MTAGEYSTERRTAHSYMKFQRYILPTGIVLMLLVGIIDYASGTELSISIFYLLPISLVTWFINRKTGVVLSIAGVIIWHLVDFAAGHVYSHPAISYWNSLVQLNIFFVTVFILSALKIAYSRKMQLIADLRKAEESIAQKARELERSNTELEQFAYMAAHDLKGPLIVVESYINKLHKRYKEKLDQDAERFIGEAVDGIERMKLLINDLLSYAKAGTQTNKFELIDCNNALERAVANLKVEIDGRNAIVTNDQLPSIVADDIQMVQLFQNLIGNGIKYCRSDQPRIHVSGEDKDIAWVLSIRDNGIGIAPEDTDSIFEIFKRLHNSYEYLGTGIGLAICKKIIERHGGRIWVVSELGKGSTFYFTIPKELA